MITETTNPVVLICTDKRKDITDKNIRSLYGQSIKPTVVLIVSDPSEEKHFKTQFPQCIVGMAPNKPLGHKWQFGVRLAQQLKPNPLIITGSDDILGPGFIENSIDMMRQGWEFGGLSWFWMQKPNAKERIMCRYKQRNWPLGGGRYYSNTLLERMHFRVFDIDRSRNLDNYGFELARGITSKCAIIWEPENSPLTITAIKGPWASLNEYDSIMNSRYIDILKTEKICAV
jgi:hypothetical protein